MTLPAGWRGRRVGTVALALVLVVVLGLGGCGDDGGDGASAGGGNGDGSTVVLRNVKFEPERISIARGQTVTWRWQDGAVQHDVAGQGFKSPIQTSGTFTHTFNDAGTFDYVCTVHPVTMKGSVEVT